MPPNMDGQPQNLARATGSTLGRDYMVWVWQEFLYFAEKFSSGTKSISATFMDAALNEGEFRLHHQRLTNSQQLKASGFP